MSNVAGLPLDRLQAGASLAELARGLDLAPVGLIEALGRAGLELDGPGVPALVQERPRRPWLEPSLTAEAWAPLLPASSRPARLALAAGLLLIHDFWDASHRAAQEADDLGERRASAYWHALAHRREPDHGNAAYWFRRVGRHTVLDRLAEASAPFLAEHGDPSLSARLLARGAWDPFAFLDLCSARPGSPEAALALRLQRLELRMLLEHTAEAVAV